MPRTSAVKQAIAELSDFAQIYDFLEKYNRSIGNDESTFNRYIAQLAKFCVNFKRYPDQVSNEEYIGYYNGLRQSNPSGGTLKLAVYGVRMYFDAKNIVPPRHAIPPIKEPKRVPTYLTEEEAMTLVLCGENRKVKVQNGALLAWGLRAQELVDLKLEDIDLKAGLVCIRASKGKKDRIIPTPPLYNRILENYIKEAKPTTYLIEKEDGAQVTVGYLRYCLKKAAIKSKINKRIYLHLFRSTYAIQNILNGLNIYSLSKYMGHSSIVTTAQYLKALPDDVYGQVPLAFDKIFSIENRQKLALLRPDLFNN